MNTFHVRERRRLTRTDDLAQPQELFVCWNSIDERLADSAIRPRQALSEESVFVMRSSGDAATRGACPAGVRRILIVGAGGFGREVAHWIRDALGEQALQTAGFLSAEPRSFQTGQDELPVVGNPDRYEWQEGDALVLAIGVPETRRRVTETLLSHGARFLTLIHPTAIVCSSAIVGEGSVICPNAIVSDAARVGRFVLVNYNSSLAHDSMAGDFAVLSPYSTLAGGASIGEDAFLGLHASVGPGVSLGARTKVCANSCALHDAPDDCLVHGVPGRASPRLS